MYMYMYVIRAEPAIARENTCGCTCSHVEKRSPTKRAWTQGKLVQKQYRLWCISQQSVTSDGVAMARSREVCAFLDQTVKSAC